MRIEFTNTFEDVWESTIPEAYGGDPRRFRRRWIKMAIVWMAPCVMLALWLWLERLIPQPAVPAAANPPRDLSVDVLPSLLPAIYVWLMYVVAIWKTWRKSRKAPSHAAPRRTLARRVTVIAIGAVSGGIAFVLMNSDITKIWYPSRTQIILIAIAPWAVLIIFMHVLGVLQRGGNARQQWLAQPGWRRPKVVELDENGYHISDAVMRRDMAWSCFPRARETSNLLVLIGEDGQLQLIPKRALSDGQEVDQLRALLQNMIKETSFLVKPGGFAVLPKPVLAARV